MKAKIPQGQTLLPVMLFFILALIIIPFLIFQVRQEGLWTTKIKRSTTAFHLAEAGLDRGYWKLIESSNNWDLAKSSYLPSPYNGLYVFTDMPGGEYKVFVGSGSEANTVRIIGVGRDSSTNEVRAVQAIYSKEAVDSSVDVDAELEWKPNLTVHWGKVVSYTEIELDGSAVNVYWPFKHSKGAINPWDTDGVETETNYYHSYDVNLGDPPTVNLTYYYQIAISSSQVPTSNSDLGNPTKIVYSSGGYFEANQDISIGNGYWYESSTSVIHIKFLSERTVTIKGSAAKRTFIKVKALIVENGRIKFNGSGNNNYTVNVPTYAWKQYLGGTVTNPSGPGDTAAADEYPGDAGYHTVKPTYTIPQEVFVHGFIYTKDLETAAGNNAVVGVIKVTNELSINTFYVYYDKDIADDVQLQTTAIKRQSWQEVKRAWSDGF